MKTIKFSKFKQLQFTNSKRLPQKVNIGDRLMEWVGIGWVDIGHANRRYPTVVEDDEQ